MKRAAAGARQAQIIALWQSGELAAAARATSSQDDMARQLGMTADAMRSAIDGARKSGYRIPSYRELRAENAIDEWDDMPTQPAAPRIDASAQMPRIGMRTATVQHDAFAYREADASMPAQQPSCWPHVEAFDAVGAGNEMLPAHGPGVRRSTLLRDGEPILQWIKNPGAAQDPQALIDEVLAALADTARAEPLPAPSYADEDILNLVPIGDAHVGMLAWAPEAGDNFDTTIAERDLMTAARRLASRARPAKYALLINVGDFTHADGPSGVTTKGTKLDMDGRWPRVIGTSIRLGRQLIDLFLRTHEIVDVKWARGNHDETAALVIAIALAQFYEHEPRVRIDTSPEFYHWHRFGLNLIGVHHSEKAKKPADLFGVMAIDRAADWGETRHRRFYCGHLHHAIVKEERTVVCEWVPTLAASDAWHRGMGYRACRELRLDTFHRQLGMIDRHIVGIDEVRMLQEAG